MNKLLNILKNIAREGYIPYVYIPLGQQNIFAFSILPASYGHWRIPHRLLRRTSLTDLPLSVSFLLTFHIIDNVTAVHHDQAVADLDRILHVMGNH